MWKPLSSFKFSYTFLNNTYEPRKITKFSIFIWLKENAIVKSALWNIDCLKCIHCKQKINEYIWGEIATRNSN